MVATRVSSKGQVVLPKTLRDELDWVAGTDLAIERRTDAVSLRRNDGVRPTDDRRGRRHVRSTMHPIMRSKTWNEAIEAGAARTMASQEPMIGDRHERSRPVPRRWRRAEPAAAAARLMARTDRCRAHGSARGGMGASEIASGRVDRLPMLSSACSGAERVVLRARDAGQCSAGTSRSAATSRMRSHSASSCRALQRVRSTSTRLARRARDRARTSPYGSSKRHAKQQRSMTAMTDPRTASPRAARLRLLHRGAARPGGDAHALRARRQRAGRARPRHRPLLRPRLQHREPHRIGDAARAAPLAHHRGDDRHARGARADPQPARPHGLGASRHRPDRARPPRGARRSRCERELALVKVAGTGEKRIEALRLADAFKAEVVDATPEHFIFQLTGRTVEDRAVHRHHAADGPGRGLPHRRRRHGARRGGDVVPVVFVLSSR